MGELDSLNSVNFMCYNLCKKAMIYNFSLLSLPHGVMHLQATHDVLSVSK